MLYQSYLSVIYSKYDSARVIRKTFFFHSNSSVGIYSLDSVIDLTITEKIQTNKKSLLCGGHYLEQTHRFNMSQTLF